MANSVSRYLKQAGIKLPYEDMTEAQIQEKNKANPLSGYGYYSAQEKAQMQAQREAYQQALDREAQMYQQQMLMQMPAERAIGHYAGQGLMGLMNQIRGYNKQQTPEQAPQNDPELDRYNQLVAEVGQAGALEILGQETGNSAMLQEAQKLRREEEERKLDTDLKKQQLADLRNKPNKVINAQFEDENGNPYIRSLEAVGVDPETGENIYKEVGKAKKDQTAAAQVAAGAGGPKTAGGMSSDTQAFEAQLRATANTFDGMDKIREIIMSGPGEGQGWAGELVAKGQNFFDGIKNLADSIAPITWDGVDKEVIDKMSEGESAWNWTQFRGVATKSARLRAQILALAYARAAATGDSSRSLSDKDIQYQLDQLAANVNDRETFLTVLDDVREMTYKALANTGRYSLIEGKPIANRYKPQLEELRIRAGVGTVRMYKNGIPHNIPAREVAEAESLGYTRE